MPYVQSLAIAAACDERGTIKDSGLKLTWHDHPLFAGNSLYSAGDAQWPPRLSRPPRWYCLAVWYSQLDQGSALAAVQLPGTTAFGTCNQRPCGSSNVWVPDCDGMLRLLQRACYKKIQLSINNRLMQIQLSIMEKFWKQHP